jgi:hypothetical protein
MTATLSIDFSNISNANTTLMQDPAVINRIRDALALMLNVPLSKIIIDDVEWVSNGVSTKFHLIARRLSDAADGLYISYKVLQPLSISAEEYSTKVPSLAAPLSAALAADVSVTSTNLQQFPPILKEKPEAKSSTNAVPFAVVGSLVALAVVGSAIVYNRKRRNAANSKNSLMLRNPYKSDFTKVKIMDQENLSMSAPNQLFIQSKRSMVSHNPMQVRRPLV